MPDFVEFNIKPKVPDQDGYKVLDGFRYAIGIRYVTGTGKWYIDLTSTSETTVSITGRALLQGKNILAQHGYGHILGELWVVDTAGTSDDPTYEGMGDRWRLRYYPRAT